MSSNSKPITQQRDLAKLPRALAPLLERPQWAVWRWTQKPDGTWQKPPFQAKQPDRHVSTSDSSTWSTFETALATVQTCQADGISYILTEDDPFAAIEGAASHRQKNIPRTIRTIRDILCGRRGNREPCRSS